MNTRRAVQAFEAFKGEKPAKLRRSRLPDSDVTGWEMGPVLGVAYEARRDGQTQRYFHEFKKSARPRLVSSDTGRQLYIEGGRYRVTDRGIEDMPNLFVVNPSDRSGNRASRRKDSAMARRAPRRRRRSTNIFVANPRRRRARARRRAPRRTIFARNPARRRRRRYTRNVAARVYRRNPTRRARSRGRTRRYRRNPIGGISVGRLSNLMLPAIGIGVGALAVEVIVQYMPIPIEWKAGPMRYVVTAATGVAIGLVIAKVFKQKRLGYFFAAGGVAISAHNFAKAWLNQQAPAIRGLGFTNPGSVARMGGMGRYYSNRALPRGGMSEYSRPLGLGGANTLPNARQPGGEMNFAA